MDGSDRRAATLLLRAVRVEGAYTNLVLPTVLARHGLTGRDAAFATELGRPMDGGALMSGPSRAAFGGEAGQLLD